MTPSAPRAPLDRGTIIAAARDLIADAGLEALSLRRLAARLGVTAAALYAHVQDKRDLLRGVAEGEFSLLGDAFDRVAERDPLERVRAQARAYVDVARRRPELFRVMFLFPPGPLGLDVPGDAELPGATRVFATAAATIEEAVSAGLLHAEDALLVTLTFWAAAHGVATVVQLGLAEVDQERLIDEIVDRLLAGYGATPRPS